MRPNTPHFVVTPESAICHGGHFYAMSTIQDTVFVLYHMFVASKRVTNTEHSHDAHLLLRRMVIYFHYVLFKLGSKPTPSAAPYSIPHIPDVSTFDGVIDLFMLCIIMELGDLINPLAYRKKYRNGWNRDHDRLSTIHACGLSRDLRTWWHAHYRLYDPQEEVLVNDEALFKAFFCQHIRALISYKRAAEKKEVQGEVE